MKREDVILCERCCTIELSCKIFSQGSNNQRVDRCDNSIVFTLKQLMVQIVIVEKDEEERNLGGIWRV